jgi:hypothetical protein
MNIFLIILTLIIPIISLKHIKPKLCINCKYFIPNNDIGTSEFAKCSFFKTKKGKLNYLINGINKEDYYYCSIARDTNDMCGEEGKYYKKKIVKNGHIK